MKKSIFIITLILACFTHSNATNYYLSSSLGNDLSDGKSTNTAWKSISKLNAMSNSLQPGDSVLFKCNDSFSGQLIMTKSGTAYNNIYFGSYGSGNKPVISGTTIVGNWIQKSTNLWEATCTECCNNVANFFINDVPQQMGRWPNITDTNKGYRTYNSHSGLNQITDSALSDSINWTGAEAVVRPTRWILNRLAIKEQNNDTLLFSSPAGWEFIDGYGYFIQNDPRTLDQHGEWYYNPVNKKIELFSSTDPNSYVTKASILKNLVLINSQNNITIENLNLFGSDSLSIFIDNSNNILLKNNMITCSGIDAIKITNSGYVNFDGNLINHSNNEAIVLYNCNNSVLRNNRIKNTALIPGMGYEYHGILLNDGENIIAEYNTLDSVGYLGITFNGDEIIIRNNVISNYCMTLDDGGGIYSWHSGIQNYSRKIIGNIVFNGIGAQEGSGWIGLRAQGIYIDDGNTNVDIIGNTVFNCPDNGIVIHNASYINVKGNLVYNNATQFLMDHDNIAPAFPITNCKVDSNIFVSKEAGQWVASFHTTDNGIPDMGTFDYNYYCRPLDDAYVFNLRYIDGSYITKDQTLNNWRINYNRDIHSAKSPITLNEYIVNSALSSNYITNGTFENNTSGWYWWSNYGNCTISITAGEGVTGNALKAGFSTSSGKNDSYLIVASNGFSLTKGKFYKVRFSAHSNLPNTVIQIWPRMNKIPYDLVADPKNFVLNTTFCEYEYVLTPDVSESESRIDFQLPEGMGDI